MQPMRDIGMRLFENPVPTGWSETGDDWINSNPRCSACKFVNRVAHATPGGGAPPSRCARSSRATATRPRTASSASSSSMVFHHELHGARARHGARHSHRRRHRVFDITARTAEARLQRMVGTVFSYPGLYQLPIATEERQHMMNRRDFLRHLTTAAVGTAGVALRQPVAARACASPRPQPARRSWWSSFSAAAVTGSTPSCPTATPRTTTLRADHRDAAAQRRRPPRRAAIGLGWASSACTPAWRC